MSNLFDEPEDDDLDLRFIRKRRTCPECRGSCEDKQGDPCTWCAGEGEI